MTVLPQGVTTLHDFTREAQYGLLTAGRLTGTGRGPNGSTLTLAANSSTRRRSVPTKKGSTNPLYLVKLAGGSDVIVRDLAVVGTPQGHLYNGLRIDRARNVEVAETRIAAIPGSSDINPGETFLLNLYRCDRIGVHDVELDGAGIGASGLGLNTCSGGLTVTNVTGHDLKYCKAVALWKQQNGGRFTNLQSLNNAFGIGFERCDGHYELDRPKSRGSRRADIHLANDGGQYGKTTLHISDPDLQPGQRITVLLSAKELGNPNQQRSGDVTCTVKGRIRNDLLRFVTRA